jgi:hypothetical protein
LAEFPKTGKLALQMAGGTGVQSWSKSATMVKITADRKTPGEIFLAARTQKNQKHL